MIALSKFLPQVYEKFLSSDLKFAVPEEPRATCGSCTMCGNKDRSNSFNQTSFNPNTKCCTFFPRLPNYLIGAILSDDRMKSGHAVIASMIEKGVGVYPFGIVPSRKYDMFFKLGKDGFGKSETLLCPYYVKDSGQCSIWLHREAVCSTYFCKNEQGQHGHDFWMSFKKFLIVAEQRLTDYVLLELIPGALKQNINKITPKAVGELSVSDMDDLPVSGKVKGTRWGKWAGKEREFYIKAFSMVKNLSVEEFEKIIGIEGTIKLRTLQKSHMRMNERELPKHLRFNPRVKVGHLKSGAVLLNTYSSNNPLVLQKDEYAAIRELHGGEALSVEKQRVEQKYKVTLSDDLIKKAYQYAALVES